MSANYRTFDQNIDSEASAVAELAAVPFDPVDEAEEQPIQRSRVLKQMSR